MAITKTKQRKKKHKKEMRKSVVSTPVVEKGETEKVEAFVNEILSHRTSEKPKDTYNLTAVSYTLFGGGKLK